MKKIISFTDFAKELFVVFISPKKEATSTRSHPVSNDFLEPRHAMRKSIQNFRKWKEEFFTLDGFDNYNDVYPD